MLRVHLPNAFGKASYVPLGSRECEGQRDDFSDTTISKRLLCALRVNTGLAGPGEAGGSHFPASLKAGGLLGLVWLWTANCLSPT